MLTALNKIDLIEDRGRLEVSKKDFPESVFLSAKTGENLEALISRIEGYFSGLMLSLKIIIPHTRMELVDFFYRMAKVNRIDYLQEGIKIDLTISRKLYNRIGEDKDIKIA